MRCGECRYEMLVAFSFEQRELCPSRGPFVLVILTRGFDEDAVSGALMADVTRILYESTQPAE